MSEIVTDSMTYQPDAATVSAGTLSLNLEPEYVDIRAGLADLADIDAMLNLVRSGSSAVNRQIDRCPWGQWREDDALLVTLRLWVWPSDLDLPYTLVLPDGVTSSAREFVSEPRTKKYWIAGATAQELPWLLAQPRLSWQQAIGTYNDYGAAQAAPKITLSGLTVHLGSQAWGVLVAGGRARGYLHRLTAVYPKYDAEGRPQRIEAHDFEVIARWPDAAGTLQEERCTMTMPACVSALLAACPDGRPRTSGSVKESTGTATIVYYNTCTGRVLGYGRTRVEKNGK